MRLLFASPLIAVACTAANSVAAQTIDEGTSGAEETTLPATGIAPVVVTAQRRQENVQDSSLSIDVLSANDLIDSNVVAAEGLSRLVPNLEIGSFVYSRIYLRGVGDNTANGISQSAVAVNVDNVHVARTTQYGGNFYDLERVEVLKGPQGTLYGRNASAGVINYITKAPTDALEGNLIANVGNYGFVQAQGALNLPVADDLNSRFAFNVVHRNGYLEDGYNDAEQQSARFRLRWDPGNLTLDFKADYTHQGGMGASPVLFPAPDGVDPWMASSGELVRQYQIAANAPQIPDDGFVDNDYAGVSLELNADLGFADLTVIPAYRWQDFSFYISPAGTLNFAEADQVEQKTLEVRLAKSTSDFDLVVGGYYFDEVTDVQSVVDLGARAGALTGPAQIRTFYHAPTEALAFFADGNVSLVDGFRVLAGVRYTDEERGLFGNTTTYSSIPSVPLCAPEVDLSDIDPSYIYCSPGTADNSVKNDAWTWRAGAELDVGDDSMLFFTVDRGFKSGGVYSGRSPGNDYGPEFLTSYTLGMRNQLFGNSLQLNLEGFYWDYTDYQFTFVNVDTLGVPALVTRNAGEARVYGGNIDIVWHPGVADTFSLNVEYLDAKFEDFTYSGPFPVDSNRLCPGLGIVDVAQTPGGGTTPLFGFDCSGLSLPRAPKWTINAGYQHVFELDNGGDVVFDVDGKFSSTYNLDLTYVEFMKQDPFVWLNAQIAYHAPGDRWSLAAWMQNITNEVVYNDARRFGSTDFAGADIRPPRTFGVRGQVRF